MIQPPTRVKICCISSIEEAGLAVRAGASALGLVSEMPSGPGVIPDDLIRRIAVTVPPGVATFLLTSRTEVEPIVQQQRSCRANTIQICDRPREGTHAALRRMLPGVSLVQVVHVTGEESVREASALEGKVDAILLDSGNTKLAVKELGGTGRTHDWEISRRICREVAVPVFLAGGLGPDNVADAIGTVRPFGVDLCSGVRTAGRLDESKLAGFFRSVRSAS